ncbi:metallopeptidase TldD-related protein [uncultured Jatrophihabitans sp.]|uniref:metallopeptidase TldD-related protein n=1 Tax=uncultured Jatrophihabitans sp. TaxID=1610747 RepID=UPI0035C95DFB
MSTRPQELVEAALAASGADGCVVVATEHSETNLRWAGNSLTTNGQTSTRSVTVVSTFDRPDGTSAGVVTRSVASLEEIDDLVRASEEAGRDAAPADDAMPLVKNYPHDDDWAADARHTDVGVFDDFAPALGRAFRSWQDTHGLLYGFAEHHLTSTFLGTSTGLRRRFDQPDGRVEINGKSADLARSAWIGRHTVDFTDIDVDALIGDLEQRLQWAATRLELPPGRYETILPPTAVADLMVYTYWNLSARDAEEGRNVFARSDSASGNGDGAATRIGERLAELPLTLRSDPAAPGLFCSPFEVATSSSAGVQSVFDNGQPVPPVDWIQDGTLHELVRTRSWAQRTGSAPRPYVDNLVLDGGGSRDLEQMIAGTERGLLLTCLWYIREVDPQNLLLTGLTRDGVYLVEDGEVRGAVNNFRFNESPVDLLARASEVGATVPAMSREWNDYFRRTAMPALRIPDFNMSTVSQAS